MRIGKRHLGWSSCEAGSLLGLSLLRVRLPGVKSPHLRSALSRLCTPLLISVSCEDDNGVQPMVFLEGLFSFIPKKHLET